MRSAGLLVSAACLACVGMAAQAAQPTATAQPASAAQAADSAEPVSATWKDKELTFVYQGFTTKYSCDGLRDKVRGVLLDLGADRKSLKVQELGCTSAAGRPDPFPGVKAKLRVLEPVSGGAEEKTVAAHWKAVDLKLPNSFSTDSGECELVEQIRQKVVPLFAARNVQLQTNCIPHQASATRPTLKLEVLAPDAPRPGEAPPAGQ